MKQEQKEQKLLNEILYTIIISLALLIGCCVYLGNIIGFLMCSIGGFILICIIKDYYGIRDIFFNSKYF